MKKRLHLTAIIVTLILSLLSSAVVTAEGESVLYLAPVDQTVAKNAETTVEVWLGGVADFYGAQFELSFDPAVVEGISIVEGAAFTAYPDEYEVVQSEVVSGTARFAATLLRVPKAGPLSGDLHLATLTLRGAAEGISALTLGNVELSDSYGQPVPFVTQDGSITVACETKIEGQALLEGRQDHSGILITLEGSTTLTTTTNVSGTYAFDGLEAGTYTLTMSYEGFLSVEIGAYVQECSTVGICPLTLLAGDLNYDGVIDIGDLALCAANFGTAGPEGDVNADGLVNIYDLVLIGKNFKLSSPQQGACG